MKTQLSDYTELIAMKRHNLLSEFEWLEWLSRDRIQLNCMRDGEISEFGMAAAPPSPSLAIPTNSSERPRQVSHTQRNQQNSRIVENTARKPKLW